MKENIFIDTDICDDIDDLWAVILALKIKKFNIIGISLSMGDTAEKAKFMAKVLAVLKMTNIPIFVGDKTNEIKNFHEEYYQNFDLSTYPGKIYTGMQETVNLFNSYENIKLLSLAPMTNIKKIFELSPHLLDKAQVIAMGGSLYKGYLNQDKASPEYNILMDLEASKYVFENVKDCILAPLDVCRDFIIDGKNYQFLLLSKDDDIQLLIENYKLWERTYVGGALKYDSSVSSTILYDVVPVIYLICPDLFTEVKTSFDVLTTGLTSVNKNGKFHIKSLVNWTEEEIKYDLVTEIYLGGLFENKK